MQDVFECSGHGFKVQGGLNLGRMGLKGTTDDACGHNGDLDINHLFFPYMVCVNLKLVI